MSPQSELRTEATGLVIGEAFIDLIAQDESGRRIYVPKFGGSPLNVAVGLRRLGTPVRLAATLGPGAFSDALRGFCDAEDIDISSLSTLVTERFVTVATPQDGHVSYEYFGDLSALTNIESVDPEAVTAATVIHASSTALNAEPSRSTVREAFTLAPGFRSLDPNPRPSLIADKTQYLNELDRILPLVDLIKVSDEDLDYLVPGATADEAALRLHAKFGSTVVVTRAASPTLLAHDGALTSVDVPPTEVLDATGAGDSFMASLLADVSQAGVPLTTEHWHAYIRRANQAAAATCQGTGGAESMPTADFLVRGAPAFPIR